MQIQNTFIHFEGSRRKGDGKMTTQATHETGAKPVKPGPAPQPAPPPKKDPIPKRIEKKLEEMAKRFNRDPEMAKDMYRSLRRLDILKGLPDKDLLPLVERDLNPNGPRVSTCAMGEAGENGKITRPPLSTKALGEEGGKLPKPPITEPPLTTLALGEEGGSPPPATTAAVGLGEEGGDPPPPMTTLALGEEGGEPPVTTQAVGEEGGEPPMTTLALGEEGGKTPTPPPRRATTMAMGEEGGRHF